MGKYIYIFVEKEEKCPPINCKREKKNISSAGNEVLFLVILESPNCGKYALFHLDAESHVVQQCV